MPVGGIYGSSGYGNIGTTTSVRPAEEFVRTDPTQQRQPAQAAQALGQEQTRQAVSNTAPTEDQRQAALSDGRSRGSFVDIQA